MHALSSSLAVLSILCQANFDTCKLSQWILSEYRFVSSQVSQHARKPNARRATA